MNIKIQDPQRKERIMAQTLLILGASGLFGSQAARAFAAVGWTVRKYQRGTDIVAAAQGADVIANAMSRPLITTGTL